MRRCYYPVCRLYGQIFDDLAHYPSLDMLQGFDKDRLMELIQPIDLDCKCTNVAEVKRRNNPETLDMEDYIELSIAYCQFIWILCDIAISSIDRLIAIGEAKADGKDKDLLIKANEVILTKSDEELNDLLDTFNLPVRPTVTQFRMQTTRLNELLKDDDFNDKMGAELVLGLSLLPDEGLPLNFHDFSTLDMDKGYGLTANGCFIKGISFLLLHETAHIHLGHSSVNPSISDEEEADDEAFSILYSEATDNERFSAVIGIICMLFSLVIKDFGCIGDDAHPREDIRLFHIVDMISAENEKYRWLTAYLFILWAQIRHPEGFPDIAFNDSTAIDQIKAYFNDL